LEPAQVIIVLGGSRLISSLPAAVLEKIDSWVNEGHHFFIGDAAGSDRAFQTYLSGANYPNVVVMSSAGVVRNNLGNWPIELVDSGLKSKSHSIHAFKDRKMTSEADAGLMIWDCESAGTLSNVIDLLRQGKECKIWIAPDAELCNFDDFDSLNRWLLKFPDVKLEAEKRLAKFDKRKTKRLEIDPRDTLFG
jgi:hypothetical protein